MNNCLRLSLKCGNMWAMTDDALNMASQCSNIRAMYMHESGPMPRRQVQVGVSSEGCWRGDGGMLVVTS